MSKAWFVKHRPTKIEDYIFESESDKKRISRFFENKEIDGNLILDGEAGTGKSSLKNILISKLINNKEENVLYCPKKIDDLRENLYPKLILKPRNDKKRLIIMEELQTKNYSYDVLTQLKDKYMEEFQEYNTFIATTNYISQLSDAIIDRFRPNIFSLGKKDKNDELFRLNQLAILTKRILDDERIKYTIDNIKSFIINNKHLNIRHFISKLQQNCYTGELTNVKISYDNTGSPNEVIDITLTIFKQIIDCDDKNERSIIPILPKNTRIGENYSRLLTIIANDNELDYKYIFNELMRVLDFFIPLKIIAGNHLDLLENRRHLFINYLSFLQESFNSLISIVELKQIDFEFLKKELDRK